MKNKLEDFIHENRDSFDSYQPSNKVWQAIEDNLSGKNNIAKKAKQSPFIKWSSVAAAVLIVSLTTYYLFHINQQAGSTLDTSANNIDLPEGYKEEVYHFTKLIELKHKQLEKIEKDQPELYRQFSGDILRLDSNYQALRKELPGHPNQEVLIQTMIINLKWQIDLLNQQLQIIQKINQAKTNKNEKLSQSA